MSLRSNTKLSRIYSPPGAPPRQGGTANLDDIGGALPGWITRINESFDQPDSTTLGPDLPWTSNPERHFDTSPPFDLVTSTNRVFGTVSNELTADSDSDDLGTSYYAGRAYADVRFPISDLYCEVEVTAVDAPHISQSQIVAVGARLPDNAARAESPPDGTDGYDGFWFFVARAGSGDWKGVLALGGFELSATSLIDGGGITYGAEGIDLVDPLAAGDVLRIEVTGAAGAETIRGLVNGVEIDSRDTSELSGLDPVLGVLAGNMGRYCGVRMAVWGTPGGMTFDNFEAGIIL